MYSHLGALHTWHHHTILWKKSPSNLSDLRHKPALSVYLSLKYKRTDPRITQNKKDSFILMEHSLKNKRF